MLRKGSYLATANPSPQTRCPSPRVTPQHYLEVYFNCRLTWDLPGPGKVRLEQIPAALVSHQAAFQQVSRWFITLHAFVYCSMNSFVADCGRIRVFFLNPCVQVLSACQHSKLNCWWKDTDPTLEDELFQLLMQVRFWDREQKGKRGRCRV